MEKSNKFTHYCDDKKNTYFNVYDVESKVSTKYEVPYMTDYLFDSVQINSQIYFSGGGIPETKIQSEKVFNITMRLDIILDETDPEVTRLDNMCVERANHSLVAIKENLIYAIGGCNREGQLSSCEVYDIKANKWQICASLSESKMWVIVCPFNDRYLYAFGGSTNTKPKK